MMGDPRYFSIKKGANPHTRNFLGLKKHVDRKKAQAQWDRMTEILSNYDVHIHAIPPNPEFPGLVFPANGGLVLQSEARVPLSKREFLLSHLTVSRSGESAIYRSFLNQLGVVTHEFHHSFEGEADFVPWGESFLFTFGRIEPQRWVLRLGFPPWRRVYGFRSEKDAIEELALHYPKEKILLAELSKEAFYHGDTVLCSFGPKREYLLLYLPGIMERDRKEFQGHPNVIPLSEQDAWRFAANSFQIKRRGQCILFMPEGVRHDLRKLIEAKGVEVVPIDVSEFFEKGGGSVKCMIGDLGAWAPEPN